MYIPKELMLGVCPIGKQVFSHEDAKRQKTKLFSKLSALGVAYIGIDEVVRDGIVRSQADVEAVVGYFSQQGIDALFLPHCNFGTEGAAGMIARELALPTLLWGPRDYAPLPDGARTRDTLCGLFATSGVLNKLGVTFTYIPNCAVEETEFSLGLERFLRAAYVVKKFRNMRIGLIGGRIGVFWSCIVNENELLDRFNIQVLPFEMPSVIERIRSRAEKLYDEYDSELNSLSWLDRSGADNGDLIMGLAGRDVLLELAREARLDVLAIESFNAFADALGCGDALAAALAAENLPIADESDLHGAISAVMLRAASASDSPGFFPEFVTRHPYRDDAACLWHSGAPISLRDPSCDPLRLAKPWILPGDKPSSLQFKLRDGSLTVCRFDGAHNSYSLCVGQCETVDGPVTRDFYAWVRVDDWKRWERTLIEGPYIHHLAATYDLCADVLIESARYIPGLKVEVLGGI